MRTVCPAAAHVLRRVTRNVLSVAAAMADSMPRSSKGLVRIISREQDTRHADDAARTLALAMSTSKESCCLWTKYEKDHFNDWFATAHNYQLRMPTQPFIHTLMEPPACTAYAYWYPEQKAVVMEGQGPEPEGAIDASPWERLEGRPLLQDLLDFLETGRNQFLKEHGPFLYIAFLGVHPSHHGQGLGSAMLEYLCDQADARGKWAYLEASNADNARLYARHGFEPCGRQKTFALPELVPGVSLTLTAMGRPPQNKG